MPSFRPSQHRGGGAPCGHRSCQSYVDADAVTLFLASATGYTGYGGEPIEDPVVLRETCRTVIMPLIGKGYVAIRERHVRDHQSLFNRCWLKLGPGEHNDVPTDERLEALRHDGSDDGLYALLFHYGRYLLMASSRPGSQPANLQGIWNDQVRPPWSCNWTTNINTQMNYWHAETTNLAECHEPLLELVADLSRAGAARQGSSMAATAGRRTITSTFGVPVGRSEKGRPTRTG